MIIIGGSLLFGALREVEYKTLVIEEFTTTASAKYKWLVIMTQVNKTNNKNSFEKNRLSRIQKVKFLVQDGYSILFLF